MDLLGGQVSSAPKRVVCVSRWRSAAVTRSKAYRIEGNTYSGSPIDDIVPETSPSRDGLIPRYVHSDVPFHL